jgi:hypothetical protein
MEIHRETYDWQWTHVSQDALIKLVKAGKGNEAFFNAFNEGDGLFNNEFGAADGVGAHVGQGQRFTRAPRADLSGPGEWANHIPSRTTGPNAQSCGACHSAPAEDGAGIVVANEARDPLHSGDSAFFLNRNTTHLFGAGGVQRLAEEMTDELQMEKDAAQKASCASGKSVTAPLVAKRISFGSITVSCNGTVDTTKIAGVDKDLVVRPFQWKGSVAFIRDFNRGAANNELGMQGVELVGDGVDGDFDGVVDEFSIGDITALAVYNAAQPRPTTRVELARLKLIPKLSKDEHASILRGAAAFKKASCAACHTPELTISNPIYSEPSQSPAYRDAIFPAGQDPVARLVDPRYAITFDLTKDTPENQIKNMFGHVKYRLGAFEKDTKGRAIVRLFGDLKRHDLGRDVAEAIDETGSGASVFLTRPLWGVGSTAPYMHDGRATSIEEAITYHGGEAADSRKAYNALSKTEQADLVAYLKNNVLFKIPDTSSSWRKGD